jgi:hypothetical protein
VPFEFNPSNYISTTEAARILGVSPGTLRCRRSEGVETLPYIRVGTSVLYERRRVEQIAQEAGR